MKDLLKHVNRTMKMKKIARIPQITKEMIYCELLKLVSHEIPCWKFKIAHRDSSRKATLRKLKAAVATMGLKMVLVTGDLTVSKYL